MHELQQRRLRAGQYIPGVALDRAEGSVSASSRYLLRELRADGAAVALDTSRAMLLPVAAGALPTATFRIDAAEATELRLEVRKSSARGNFTPECVMHRQTVQLKAGCGQQVTVRPFVQVDEPQYVAYCLLRNPAVKVHTSEFRVTGVLSLSQSMNKAVAKGARQEPPSDSGIDSFEFWLPSRRPAGRNLALTPDPPIDLFGRDNVQSGVARPATQPNTWGADPGHPNPCFTLRWSLA